MLDVKVRYRNGKAKLSFTAKTPHEVYFKCDHPDHTAPDVYDFAAFACLAIASKFETDVVLDGPVTREAAAHCDAIAEFNRMIDLNETAFRVRPTEIVDGYTSPGDLKSLCLSGGIDSTYVLATEHKNHNFTHALLVQGADYRAWNKAGFETLFDRVSAIAAQENLNPMVVRTNLRSIRYKWGRHHINQLAACMHFLGPKFSAAALAADCTVARDMLRFPWGNNCVTSQQLSGDGLRVHYLGSDATRDEKIRYLQEDGRFLSQLGVCAADKDGGGNCGLCVKCIMTRLSFERDGRPCPDIFDEMPDIATQLTKLARNRTKRQSRGTPIRANELLPFVPDPDVKAALIKMRDAALWDRRPRSQHIFARAHRRFGRTFGLWR